MTDNAQEEVTVESGLDGPTVEELDAAYKPFPPFSEWAACTVDQARWERYIERLKATREGASPEVRARALDIVKKAAAITTGAIEGLYEADRGFTFTAATQSAYWEAALRQKGASARSLIEAQLRAYDAVVDLATQSEPLSEAAIRALHAEICSGQETYVVYTEHGTQEQELPKGEYKRFPNHVLTADGKTHSYAPVESTPLEMRRLVEELQSKEFGKAHPVLQASYAHYSLVAIHPFADGNGRVARALASVYTCRAHSSPWLIFVEDRNAYFRALEAADRGDYQSFVDFVMDHDLQTIRLIEESIRDALSPSADTAAAEIGRLYVTRGGYTHAQVDQAGQALVSVFEEEFRRRADQYAGQPVHVSVQRTTGGDSNTAFLQGYRPLVSEHPFTVRITAASQPPAEAQIDRAFVLQIPRDSAKEDEIILYCIQNQDQFAAAVNELLPVTPSVQFRLRMFVDKVMGDMLTELRERAEERLRAQGY